MNNKLIETSGKENLFLYGPPGSGKSTIGPKLADVLHLPFTDLDTVIVNQSGMSIPAIFLQEGEAGFRDREKRAFIDCIRMQNQVLALGGGTLLNPETRAVAEQNGVILCLSADYEILADRLKKTDLERPLLISKNSFDDQLLELLTRREEHYLTFPNQLDTSFASIDDIVWQAQVKAGIFHVKGPGIDYDVRISQNCLKRLGEILYQRKYSGSIAIVTDENVAPLYLGTIIDSLHRFGYKVDTVTIPSGEENKNLQTIANIWDKFLSMGLDRQSIAIALGGGVVGDLTGFAAATYLRGIRWIVVPTTLLAMVDSSLGGKTGIDLPQGKNLVGAFHPPSLVIADTSVLNTLPENEFRSGMAEVIKHSVIDDPYLYSLCKPGWISVKQNLDQIVQRAMAVKIKIITEDPFEKDKRAVLNFGHTLGHALEKLSNYQIRHGEAVAIGMAVFSKLSEKMGVAEEGMTAEIISTLKGMGLPVNFFMTITPQELENALKVDKKRADGLLRVVLPVRIGEVKWGIPFNDFNQLIEIMNLEEK